MHMRRHSNNRQVRSGRSPIFASGVAAAVRKRKNSIELTEHFQAVLIVRETSAFNCIALLKAF
jgi:hypothetical protein